MSDIFCKTEPLGTELKTVAFFVTESLIFLDIQRGKEGMKSTRYHLELGTTADCTKRFMEEKKGLLQRALKESTRDYVMFNS